MTAKYWKYDEIWVALHQWASAHPDLMKVEVIGQSRNGLNLAGVTLTNLKTGEADHKSALFVDANIHAGEVATAMYWMEWCLTNYGAFRSDGASR